MVVPGAQQVLLSMALQRARLVAELQPGVAQPRQLPVLRGVLAGRQPAHALRQAGQNTLLGVQLLAEILEGDVRITYRKSLWPLDVWCGMCGVGCVELDVLVSDV